MHPQSEPRHVPNTKAQPSELIPSSLGVAPNAARDERSNLADMQYLGMEISDPAMPSDHVVLKSIIVAALIVLFTLDVHYATEFNITALYVVVIFLTLSLKRVRWVLGVTFASLLLNFCAMRWEMMYPEPGWTFQFALGHMLIAVGAQVPAGILAYRSLVTQRQLDRTHNETMRRQRAMYERERAARGAEHEARERERQATEDLRLHAEELTRTIESERIARQRASVALGERDHLRKLTENFQRTLLPQIPSEVADGQLVLGPLYQPAIQEMQMGGDFYDALILPNGMIGFVIGDVAGHGVEAAAQTAFVTTTLRAFSTEDPLSPGRVISRVNRSLTLDQHFDAFVSFFYGVYDPSSGKLRYANAGHEPPILIHPDNTYEGLQSTGLVAGVDTTAVYDELETTMTTGDCLIMLTDGMTEARQLGTRNLLGWTGVADMAVEQRNRILEGTSGTMADADALVSAELLAHALYNEAIKYSGGESTGPNSSGPGLTDDVALLVVITLAGCPIPRVLPRTRRESLLHGVALG